MTTSSANPQMLIRYADEAARINEHLQSEAQRLGAVLGDFAASCTEYSTGIGPELADILRHYAQQTGQTDAWVGQVGRDFQAADAMSLHAGFVSGLAGRLAEVGGGLGRDGMVAAMAIQLRAGALAEEVSQIAGWLLHEGRRHWDTLPPALARAQHLALTSDGWLMQGLAAVQPHAEWLVRIHTWTWDITEYFLQHPIALQEVLRSLGRALNTLLHQRGWVGRMDRLYRVVMVEGLPYRGVVNRFLRQSAGKVFIAAEVVVQVFENWWQHRDAGWTRVAVATIVDVIIVVAVAKVAEWAIVTIAGIAFVAGAPLAVIMAGIVAIVGVIALAVWLVEQRDHPKVEEMEEWVTDRLNETFTAAALAKDWVGASITRTSDRVEENLTHVANQLAILF